MGLEMILFKCIVLTLVFGVSSGVEVELVNSYPRGQVTQGTTFVIYCKFTGIDSTNNALMWERLTGDDVQVISTDTTVTNVFEQTGRYEVTMTHEQNNFNNVVYHLRISNTKPEDTSTLRCRVKDTSDSTKVLVYAAPTVEINDYKPGQTVQFLASEYKSKGARFIGRVTGAHPVPVVKVMLGFEDVTTSFRVTTTDRTVGSVHFNATVYDMVILSDNFPIRPEFDQIPLIFESTTWPYKPVKQNITLQVLSAPRLNCGGRSAKKAVLGETNYKVMCYVHGHPRPENVVWTWDDKKLRLGESAVDGISTSQLNLAKSVEVVLKFDFVRNKDFTQTFKLFTSNVYGNATAYIRLNEISVDPNSSQTVCSSMFLLLAVFVFQYFW